MRQTLLIIGSAALALAAAANQQPTTNDNPAYAASGVQAQLRLNIREDAGTVHFIRDTNDPEIITKTYVLEHADPYSIRPYLREMVQSARVDYNNPAGRANPYYYDLYHKDNAAGTAKIFVPTGVECVRFTDGTGVLMVSAEDYRFEDTEAGLGIDALVAALDQPGIVNSSGQPKFIYFPANRPASELRSLIRQVGANISNDTVELIGGKDKIEVDDELNCLFFNTALYSRKHIEEMLALYDVPHPELLISLTVYELDAENDGMLGLDFQSWKNNDGMKFFAAGAEYSRNRNLAVLPGPVNPDGTINTHYFNFDPKWNTRFLDFLVAKGKAKVVSTGDLAIRNHQTGTLKRLSGVMTAVPVPTPDPESGNTIELRPVNNGFKFEMTVTPSITDQAATLALKVATISMLGQTSSGEVRTSTYHSDQEIMLGTGRNCFYLGGIDKVQVVRDVGGVPILKDLPLLGWLFSTERESTKRSRLVVTAECEVLNPGTLPDPESLEKIELIRNAVAGRDGEHNQYGFGQYLLDDNVKL